MSEPSSGPAPDTQQGPATLSVEDFPIVEQTDYGLVTREIVDDGLTALTTLTRPDGASATTRIHWTDLDVARRSYGKSVAAFDKQIADLAQRIDNAADGDRDTSRLRFVHLPGARLVLHSNVGPPTWWLPRAGVRLRDTDTGRIRPGIQAGWLRVAVSAELDLGRTSGVGHRKGARR